MIQKLNYLKNPNFMVNLALFSYGTGMSIPLTMSPWYFNSQVGIFPLVPFQLLITLLIIFPLVFTELALGQYSNKATIKIWNFCPILKGIGIGKYAVFIIYQLYYSFQCSSILNFTISLLINHQQVKTCNNTWNTNNCSTTFPNFTQETSIEQFYLRKLLSPDTLLKPDLIICSFITSTLVFLTNFQNGTNFFLFLIAFPILQLVILFYYPLGNPIALTHLFRQADLSRFTQVDFWVDSVILSVLSSGVGLGVYTTLGTRQTFRTPLHLKSIGLSLLNLLFIVIYNITVHNFVIDVCKDCQSNIEGELPIPLSLFFLNISRFWPVMWLSHSYLLGLRSLIVMMSVNTEVIYNSFGVSRTHHSYYVFSFCLLFFLMGIPLSVGFHFIKALDSIIKNLILFFFITFTLLALVLFYKIGKFKIDLNFMLGIKPSIYWNVIYILNTFIFSSIFIYNLWRFFSKNLTVNWIYITQNVIFWSLVSLAFLSSIYHIVWSLINGKFKILGPLPDWGPRHEQLKKSREIFKRYNMANEYLYRQERFTKK